MLLLLYRRVMRARCQALLRAELFSRNAESEWEGGNVEHAWRL